MNKNGFGQEEELCKKVTLSLTQLQQDNAKKIARNIIGNSNISGLFAYWINQYSKGEIVNEIDYSRKKLNNTKKVTISLLPSLQEQAREVSKKLINKDNISGLYAYLIDKHSADL